MNDEICRRFFFVSQIFVFFRGKWAYLSYYIKSLDLHVCDRAPTTTHVDHVTKNNPC